MLLLILLLITVLINANARTTRFDDICGSFDGRRMYLELDEHGVLVAKKQNSNGISKRFDKNLTSHKQCSLELITCPSCIITVKFTFLNVSRNCGKNTIMDSCGCDYVWLYEPRFEDVSGEQFCGHFVENNSTSLIYKSNTRIIAIAFLYSQIHSNAFSLEYKAERNRQFFTGYPKYGNQNNLSQIISSPFFPYVYPRDLSVEYVIKCQTDEKCFISLIFTDFQISPSSLIEFFDWNGQRIYVATGSLFRPPVLISSGPTLLIRFYANGDTSLGFKATYSFILGDSTNSTLKPYTDCGGHVDNLGGGITMMNMIKKGTEAYDCYWIIRPPESYLYLKTHLYLKVKEFSGFAGATELVIRQGLTSNEPVVEILRHPVSQFLISKAKEHVVSISEGFYVSLKGLFRSESKLTIVYAAFSYKACYSGSDFLCNNHRCISSLLNCDGFDHCGDNSDEPPSCLQDPKDRFWSRKPNYYFPKVDQYSDLKTATIIFVACSLGLISLIFALIVLLYRLNTQAHNRQRMQDHLQTINDLLGETLQVDEEIIFSDEPPIYEAPPDYEDVINKFLKEKMKKNEAAGENHNSQPCSRCVTVSTSIIATSSYDVSVQNDEQYTTTTQTIPDSPPPAYFVNKRSTPDHLEIHTLPMVLSINPSIGEAELIPKERDIESAREIEIIEPLLVERNESPIYANINITTESSDEQIISTNEQLDQSFYTNESPSTCDDANVLSQYFDKSFSSKWLQDGDKRKGFGDFKQEVKDYFINKSRIIGGIKFNRERRFSDSEIIFSEYFLSNLIQSSGDDSVNNRRSISFENMRTTV